MALKGCYACVKYLVIIFNFLFWLAGIGVLALSIYCYIKGNNYSLGSDETKTLFTLLYIFMAAGSLMTVLGFLGCCGALKESQCMLGTFFFLVLIILIAEITVGVWAFYHREEVKNIVTDEFTDMIQTKYGIDPLANKTVDIIQHDFECCGSVNPSNWAKSKYNKEKLGIASVAGSLYYEVPKSCCIDQTNCNHKVTGSSDFQSDIYKDGCIDKLIKTFKRYLTIIAGVGIGLGVIQLLGLIFSMVLCCAIRNGEGVSYHV